MHMPESLWKRISDLPLVLEAHAVEHLSAPAPADRTTLLVRLRGGNAEGLGEDVGGTMIDKDGAFLAAAPGLSLAGEWTLGSFVAHLGGLDLWPEPPEWEMGRRWRTWAFESAALDLALQQAGLGLPEALGREAAPLRFVNSLGSRESDASSKSLVCKAGKLSLGRLSGRPLRIASSSRRLVTSLRNVRSCGVERTGI